MTKDKHYFAQRLKTLMYEKSITSAEAARATGFTEASFSYWLAERSFPRKSYLQALADYFGVPVLSFYKKEEEDIALDEKMAHLQDLGDDIAETGVIDITLKNKQDETPAAAVASNGAWFASFLETFSNIGSAPVEDIARARDMLDLVLKKEASHMEA